MPELASCPPHGDDTGRPGGATEVLRQEPLLEAGALQSAIFNSANFSSIATDARGVIQIFNVGAERMLGYAAADVVNKITPADISDPQEVIARAQALSEELDTPIAPGFEALVFKASRGIEDIYELTYIRKDGSRFPAVVSVTALRDGANAIIGYLLIGTDNTARHRIEDEQRQLGQRLRDHQFYTRTLFESNIDALMTTDPAGIITDVNKQMEALTGCTRDELIGAPFKNNFTDPERAEAGIKLALIKRKLTDYELTARDRAGRETVVSYSATTFYDRERRLQGVLAAARDITERKRDEARRVQLEAQLRESQKMEALGTLAGGVAHDFNNALAAILGNVELARQDVGPGHPALESLEEIDKASRRSKDLVQQILTFGRRQKLERKATSLALVVVETARLLRATLPAQVSLRLDCKADTPPVLADATQIKQILLNLGSNASQAVQDQGHPGVIEVCLDAHTQREARNGLAAGRYACLTVRDNGSGMDEATRARMFEPFFTTKPIGKGTGLGLSVVHGIVQAHDASVEVDSAPGEGTTLRIYFPAVDSPIRAAAAVALDAAPADGKGRHVLYVDDEEAIILLMKRLLERQGYRVSGYTDPHEALAAVRADPGQFDLAVTDYSMPGMSGLDVAIALREMRPDLPVVLASGYIDEDLRAKAPAAGIRELIYKPNTVDDLCEAVARAAQAVDETPKCS